MQGEERIIVLDASSRKKVKKMKKIIGLTGGIGTGKSTVSRLFIEQGVYVIDSDALVHHLLDQESVVEQIRENFGSATIINDRVDRIKLGKIIFHDKEKRALLNHIVHPLVKKELKKLIDMRKNKLIVLDIPLLFEAEFTDLVDEIIVVVATKEQQIERIMKRNHLTYDAALERVEAQWPIEKKAEHADYILDNTKDKLTLYEQFRQLFNKLKMQVKE